jgi:hypothetical protein
MKNGELTTPKEWNWSKRDRSSKLASILYPHLTTKETQQEMNELAKAEGKRPPQGPTLRGGQAQPLSQPKKG